jgi:hypothetical protein
MKNTIITALLVSNLFTAALCHSFLSGKMQFQDQDYLTTIAEPDAPRPVKLAKR